jgi:hypothetical protein
MLHLERGSRNESIDEVVGMFGLTPESTLRAGPSPKRSSLEQVSEIAAAHSGQLNCARRCARHGRRRRRAGCGSTAVGLVPLKSKNQRRTKRRLTYEEQQPAGVGL